MRKNHAKIIKTPVRGLLALGLCGPIVSIAEPSEVAIELLDTVQAIRGLGAASIKDGGGGSGGDGGETPSDPEAAVRQVYEDDVNMLIVSAAGGCTSSGCHGRSGAPGGLRLYGAGEDNSIELNYQSFLRYIDSNSADRLTTKISGKWAWWRHSIQVGLSRSSPLLKRGRNR